MISGQEAYVGDSKLSLVDPSSHSPPPPPLPPPLPLSEAGRVEALRVTHVEGPVLRALAREKLASASVMVGWVASS
jgi:hypothetical protein